MEEFGILFSIHLIKCFSVLTLGIHRLRLDFAMQTFVRFYFVVRVHGPQVTLHHN